MQTKEDEPRIKFAKTEAKSLLYRLKIKKPPVMLRVVVDLLRKTNEIEICKWNFGDNVDGIQITEGESITIGYNEDRHVHRQRFTVAHEIGHFILGHTKGRFIFDLNCKKPEEREANAFASELLIPAELLKMDIASGLEVKKLSSRYMVSDECLWWKIEEEKLLNRLGL